MPATETKLKAGDRIRVHGWVMLKDIHDGEYVVKSADQFYGNPTYSFVKLKGKRVVAVHFAASVDPWIKPGNHPDLNRIEIV
jgi:hypothetical protein